MYTEVLCFHQLIFAKKNRRQILSRTDRANEVNKTFIIWLLVHFLLKFATLFLSSRVCRYFIVLAFLCRFLFTPNSAFIYRVFKLICFEENQQ